MKSVNTVQNRFLRLYIVNLVSVPLRFIVFKKTALMSLTDRQTFRPMNKKRWTPSNPMLISLVSLSETGLF